MSASTQFEFVFPQSASLTVTVGNGIVPGNLGIPKNESLTYEGKEAIIQMSNSNIVGVMCPFDLAILNLLLARHLEYKSSICLDEDEANYGSYLVITHFR